MARRASIVCGNAGVGKSTFALALCRRLSAVWIDIDAVTERLAQTALGAAGLDRDDRDSPAYKALLREPVYETLFDVACENLDWLPCVIVGPFTRERREATWPTRLRRRLRAEVTIYHVCCDEHTRRERLRRRANPRDEAKLERWREYAALGVDPETLPFEHQRVDTSGVPE
jgi:predicted kinase